MKIDSLFSLSTIAPRRTSPKAAKTEPVEQYDSSPREGGFLSLRHLEVGGITSHSDGTQSVQIGGATVKSNGKVEVPLTKHLTVDSDGKFKWNWF